MKKSAITIWLLIYALPLFAQGQIKPIRVLPIATEPFMVAAGGKWSATLPEIKLETGQRVLLTLKARVDSAGYGGCNTVMQVTINDRHLNQPRGRPRLLNKPETYHLTGYQREFRWYRRSNNTWSIIFGPGFEEKSVLEGQDFTFLWEVSDLILPGRANMLVIAHTQPTLPKYLKGRGQLGLCDVALWIAEARQVEEAAQRLQQKHGFPPQVAPAINALRSNKIGERPYELVWSGRTDTPLPLVTFDDLAGWEVCQYNGAKATFERSREEQIWGEYVGKLTYTLPDTSAYILLRPPNPIPINGEFDCVHLWVCGGDDYFLKSSPQVPTIYVRIEDASGETHEISLGIVNQNYWFPQHGKFAPFRWAGEYGWPTYESWGGDGNARIEFPARFSGILIGDCKNEKELTLWFDSLAFYKEHRSLPALIPAASEPKYPTREDTILPTCAAPHKNFVEKDGTTYRLIYLGEDGRLCYTIVPKSGTLSDVSVSWKDGSSIMPLANGGIVFAGQPTPVAAKMTANKSSTDSVSTQWAFTDADGVHPYSITYRIRGKTLIVDIEVKDESGVEFHFGTVKGLANPKLIEVPYLNLGLAGSGPRVLYANGLFVLGLLDWYNTLASTFDGTAELISFTEAAINRGSKYLPRTDGHRNPLRERVFLTISPDFHEVLPNIPNPPSPRLAWASKYMYQMINPPIQPGFLRLLTLYGVDHTFAISWGRVCITRQGDSYTYRMRPRPDLTIEELAEYAKQVRALGHVFGLAGGGRDFCPLSEHWDENLVALEPDGNWRRGWPSNYIINHAAARSLARKSASRWKELYGPNVFYLDVNTHPSPWQNSNDYNALYPGAAMLKWGFRWNCDLMLEMRKHHEFIVSEGGHRWMYAGISEGDYATIPSRTPPYQCPIIVDFDLLKIHPLQHGVGMGYHPIAFYPDQGPAAEQAKKDWERNGFDRYIAATIAFGHMGCLSGCAGWPLSRTIRYFALIWPLQQEYLTDTVAEIRYHNGENFITPSRALATDAHLKGRVYVRYSRGLEVMVNYNENETWKVELGGEKYDLPPFGLVARRANHLHAYVAMRNGQRVDYVESPDLIYAHSPVASTEFPILTVHGAVLLRKQSNAAWSLIPASGLSGFKWKGNPKRKWMNDATEVTIKRDEFCKEVRVNLARLFPGVPPEMIQCLAHKADGTPSGEADMQREGSSLTLHPAPEVPRYSLQKSSKPFPQQ